MNYGVRLLTVIGLVGPFGSGCSYVANIIARDYNYKLISLSNILREIYVKDNPNSPQPTRNELQNYGNKIRDENDCGFLAKEALKQVENNPGENFIVDSIRNPFEVEVFRKNKADFYLFGIFADEEVRWKRSRNSPLYANNKPLFENDDKRDKGEDFIYGQRVTDTFKQADIIILNNDDFIEGNTKYNAFCAILKEKINIVEGSTKFKPSAEETYMTMAYAASLRSSCLKRKVGAIIVDENGTVFSSGYNEVPSTRVSCLAEYNGCYRDKLKEDLRLQIESSYDDSSLAKNIFELYTTQFKNLDYCRALHAEENAILSVAKIGASMALQKSVLYATTFPCNLCANKIAQVGIRKIIYLEPYPMEEAKKILSEKAIEQVPFEGITYNGYFRLMEVIY
jgi:deoxycytidylate deaminase